MHQVPQKLIHLTQSGNLRISYSPFQTCNSVIMLFWLHSYDPRLYEVSHLTGHKNSTRDLVLQLLISTASYMTVF